MSPKTARIIAAKPALMATSPVKVAVRTAATATADLRVDPADLLFLKEAAFAARQRGFCVSGRLAARWLQNNTSLLPELQKAGNADAFIACLPADPLGFIPREIHLSAGAVGSAIAQTDMALRAQRAGDDVVLGVVVGVSVDEVSYAWPPAHTQEKTAFRLKLEAQAVPEAAIAERDRQAASKPWGLVQSQPRSAKRRQRLP